MRERVTSHNQRLTEHNIPLLCEHNTCTRTVQKGYKIWEVNAIVILSTFSLNPPDCIINLHILGLALHIPTRAHLVSSSS